MKTKSEYGIEIPKKYECCKNCEFNFGAEGCCAGVEDPETGESLYGKEMKYMRKRFSGRCEYFGPSLEAYLKYGEDKKLVKKANIRDFMLKN